MYNFLDYKLKPFVVADCPSTDGYEVNNLISENINQKSKGFLAYTAIKPPINIDFELICPVNIYYIMIGTTVGSQKSTGIECSIKNSNSEYFTVCKAYTEDAGIIFYNRRYYSLVQNREMPDNFTIRFCRSNMYKFISCVDKFRLRILCTKSSVPCIEKIEIWGEISRTCSDVTKNTIKQLFGNNKNKVSIQHFTENQTEDTKKTFVLNIPEEFIDPISCEIMSLPMTLPCGKTVDQITLEKHQESEAKWGRSASDPFTGQTFTVSRKPLLNTALKNRIDEFLIQNSHREETFQIQRTLGRKKISGTINSAKLFDNKSCNLSENCIKPFASSNLDDLVNNAMKQYNITRYTDENELKSENNSKSCGLCNSELNLYELECKHLLCRSCVFMRTCCKTCNIIIKKCNIKKYHL